MSEGGIDYGGIVTAVIAAAAVVTIVRCLYAVMVAIARCLYAAMIAIARSLYGNTNRQQESFDEHEETEEANNVKWKKPESGWVKLNVDGSLGELIHEKPTSAGCGGVIRDEWGKWRMGFAHELDPSICQQIEQTELQAILTGLEVASQMNVKKLVVESDSEPAVSMVKSERPKYRSPKYKVVQNIKRLLENPMWLARLDYVPREENRVANYLAKLARKSSSPHYHLSKYDGPPDDDCERIFLEENN